jgi:predicted dienelactone hydrolase
MGGSGDAFPELTEHWATLGYVVILPTHDDSVQLRRRRGEPVGEILRDVSSGTRSVDPAGRIADVVLILDSLDRIEEAIPELQRDGHGLIDRTRTAIAGHSAGALTAQMAIGVKVRGRRMGVEGLAPRNVGDSRFKAAIIISGQGTTNPAFTRESWAELDKPMMVFAGSLDVARVGNETPESRRHPFELARPGHKYLVWIEGATHGSYQGRRTVAMLGERPATDVSLITAVVSSASSAFLDAYLRDDAEARAFLEGDGLIVQGRGYVKFERK